MNSRRSMCRPKGLQCCKPSVSLRDQTPGLLALRMRPADTGLPVPLPWLRWLPMQRVRRRALQRLRHSPLHEFGCERAQTIIFVVCPTVLDGDILSVNGANFCQALAKELQEARFRRLSGTEKPPPGSLMASER